MEKQKKTIVVLPGSLWQVPIIKKSREMGYRTLTVNPYENSPAFSCADGYLQSDIFDIERVVQYCIKEKAAAVISEECDIAMPVIAEIGRRLSLRTLDTKSARLFTDKSRMRSFGEKAGIPTPEYQVCKTLEEAECFFNKLQAPAILKPLDSNSSHGVFKIREKGEIKKYFQEASSFSRRDKAVLMERFIKGTEFTVDGIKTPKRHFTLAISEKKHFAHNPNIACQLYFTGSNPQFDYEELARQNDWFVNQSSLQFALTHAEYKYENGKFYLIEIAARGGGNLISSHIVPFLSGIDNYHYLLECYLGNVTSPDFTVLEEYKKRSAVLEFFEAPEGGGIAERVDGTDFLEQNPQIVAYKFNFEKGDMLTDAASDAARVGFYIACCDNKEQLDELIRTVHENVRIICEQEKM